MPERDFNHKTVIVTGAAAGMGREITLAFLSHGAYVIAVDLREDSLSRLSVDAAKITGGAAASHLSLYPGDISQEKTAEGMTAQALSLTGRLDVLVNNAGIGGHSEAIADTTDEDWNQILAVDLTGPMYAMRAAVRIMLRQEGGGNIVSVASVAGLKGCRSCAAYSVAKHGLIALSEHTAYMYMHQGIRCNCVCPGAIRTAMTSTPESENPFGRSRILSGMDPDFRFGTTEDIASAVLFLASDEARFITGTNLVVDGGMSCN